MNKQKVMSIVNIILKILLCLILFMPILGAVGLFPPPTPDLYNTPEAFTFIDTLTKAGYLNYLIAVVFAAAIVLIVMKRTALAVLLILPITVNIVAFHLFLDGGLLRSGAIPGNILLLLNFYLLWQQRRQYSSLWEKEQFTR